MTSSAAGQTPARAAAWARRVRLALGAGGFVVLAVAVGAGLLGMQSEQSLGPLQIQVGALGALLVLAALVPAPSRAIAATLARAGDRRGPAAITALSRRSRLGLAAIVGVACVFRIWLAVSYVPPVQMAMGMTLWDAEMARNLMSGRGWVLNGEFVERLDRAVVENRRLVDPEDFLPADDNRPGALRTFDQYPHTPGYALWLAASFTAGGGQRFLYAQIMQAALDASGCLLVFGIARRLWSETAGIIGAGIYALSPAHAYVAIQSVAAATDGFWVLLIGYGIVRIWDGVRQRASPL